MAYVSVDAHITALGPWKQLIFIDGDNGLVTADQPLTNDAKANNSLSSGVHTLWMKTSSSLQEEETMC